MFAVLIWYPKPVRAERPEAGFRVTSDPPRIRPTARPTPTPTPPPPAAPPPRPAPVAVRSRNRPRVAHVATHAKALRLARAPRSAASGAAPLQEPFDAGDGVLSEAPASDGLGSGSASPAAPLTSGPTPSPSPTATPKASCATPEREARTLDAVVPDRPQIALDRGSLGSVAIRVDLRVDGSVIGATVVRSAGDAALDAAALGAALRSRFAPEIVACAPHAGSYLFRVDFTG